MKKIFLSLILGVILLFIAGAMIFRMKRDKAGEASIPVLKVTGEVRIQNVFVNIAKKVGPAVVTISTERIHKIEIPPGSQLYLKRFGRGSPESQEELEKFFKQFFGYIPKKQFKQQGLGSGFIIDKEGNIITNYHVIADAEKISVTLPDGRSFPGKLRGRDPRMDVALVKIDAPDLQVAKLGDSDTLKTGEWVVAIGNPFGHILKSPEPTITVGVVSALHRHIPTDGTRGVHFDMIQTDAAINRGNSGGPLCNISGDVVGINVAIFSTSGGNQGVGFAMPINVVKNVLKDLMEGKAVSYGWLGIMVQEVSDDIAEYFKLPNENGVLVAGIVQGGPAHKYGVRPGDVIIEYDEKKIDSPYDLIRFVEETEPGSVVDIKLIRDRKVGTLQAKIGKHLYAEEIPQESAVSQEVIESQPWRGIRVRAITEEIAGELRLTDRNGVVVVDIDVSGPFYAAGIRRGHVIREMNKKLINNVAGFNQAAQKLKGKVLIRTDNGYFIINER